jgi:hypothetical protein
MSDGDDGRLIVLGCGPAGLISCHAAAMHGFDVRVFSRARKSYMNGAQYLHEPIPGVPSSAFVVDYKLIGTVEEYRHKVYGNMFVEKVSPEDLVGRHDGWDIRQAYDWLWDTYGEYVYEWDASPRLLGDLVRSWKPDAVVSSIPRPLLCNAGHSFGAATIYSTDRVIGTHDDLMPEDADVVLCNGNKIPLWYRASRIGGFENTEWSSFSPRPPITPMWDVQKPVSHNCDCLVQMGRALEIGVTCVGRYGTWDKQVLSHTAFQEVTQLCRSILSPQ